MADIEPAAGTLVAADTPAGSSRLGRLLHRGKGQPHVDEPNHDAKNPAISSDASSANSADERGLTLKGVGDAFEQGNFTEVYAPIDSYEGKHMYDPKAAWTEDEERRLIRKLDLRICSYVCFMFFALQLDRGNISQALSDHMLDDLHMNTNDYNTGQTIFYLCFLFAELPSQLVSKKLGPDNWIPIQMVSWSIVAICQSQMTGRTGFYICRALLGIFEGGFIPDVVLYLSYFYKSKELPIRLSFFWSAYCMTFIISAFLAYGILHLRGYNNMAGWQWLFIIEGAFTAAIGLFSYFYLPPSPTQTASRFRGKDGWFSPREETIMVNRILRDDPSKGDMHNRQAVTPKLLWNALQDYDMWPIYLLGLTWTIPSTPAQNYLTLTLGNLGFGTFTVNLLTIPAYVIFLLQLLSITWLSERINNRFLVILYAQIYMLPLVIALEILPGGTAEQWARYVLNMLLVGYPYVHAIIVAMTSRNAGSVKTRTVGSALYNMCVQASNIISSNIYGDADKPLYQTGNKVLIALCAWNMVLICAMKMYYSWRNKSREKVWNAMSQDQKAEYLATTTDQGNKRLDFRFTH